MPPVHRVGALFAVGPGPAIPAAAAVLPASNGLGANSRLFLRLIQNDSERFQDFERSGAARSCLVRHLRSSHMIRRLTIAAATLLAAAPLYAVTYTFEAQHTQRGILLYHL